MDWLRLTRRQRELIIRKLPLIQDAREYRRLKAIMWLAEGKSVSEVAELSSSSRQAVYEWAERWLDHPTLASLADAAKPGRPEVWNAKIEGVLLRALAKTPQSFGHLSPCWSVPLLLRHLAEKSGTKISDATLRRNLRRLGYVWKRPRYSLRKDEEASKKSAPSANV